MGWDSVLKNKFMETEDKEKQNNLPLIKILFPFQKRNNILKKYWWHRLLTVLFFISVIIAGLLPLYSAIRQYDTSNAICDKVHFDYAHISNYVNPQAGIDLAKNIRNGCLDTSYDSYVLNRNYALIFGIVFMLLISYVLQLIYFKIIYYIIFGKKLLI